MIKFQLGSIPSELRAGLGEVLRDHGARLVRSGGRVTLELARDPALAGEGFDVARCGGTVMVRYSSVSSAFRALGCLLAAAPGELAQLHLSERTEFSMRGLMIDCSRNGVMRPDALKAFLRRVALMGVNLVMLYTEDTYEVPGEPFFGYLRGAYTKAELQDLDAYAAALGIEMIPCIQTLAHLEQILKWDPYFHLRDTANILLAEDPKVYEFIRKIIRAASAPFRSKRIHIGMDEAHGLGTGRYRQLHGEQDPFAIINRHLARVRNICAELGLQPMIWSDMYFRLGSATHDYYDLKWKIPGKALKAIPANVQLVYWDYYHAEESFYRQMIANHRKLGSEPVFAGGIWTWGRKWCALLWSFTAIDAGMQACKAEGLKEAFMTMWGDDGMEADIFSALPGIQYFCEHAFKRAVNMRQVKARFAAVCGSVFDEWVRAAGIDLVPGIPKPALSWANTSVGLLWQDPLLAIMDPFLAGLPLEAHYRKLGAALTQACRGGGLNGRLRYPALIAATLARKVNLRRRLAAAYKDGDHARLRALLRGEVADLRRSLRELWKHHRAMWMTTYKPFGWEVIEQRYGGLAARLETLAERLADYLAGRLASIPELEARLVDPWKGRVKLANASWSHSLVKTPSSIK